ncbi:MAG: TerB N-terminal domain-containing protein [Clostridia bacterium]|nr:TerB N-terminal domain-containing protein [Clostridia bacterium]
MNKYDEEVRNAVSALKNRKNGVETVYTDTPILFTASQMKSYTPPQYLEMRKLARSSEAAYMPSEWLFVKQAQFMKYFIDDYNYQGGFSRFYPTYGDMNTEQLRGYFSWRTKVRQEKIEKTAPGFVFVYIFELINRIGWRKPADGYGILCDFCSRYAAVDPAIRLDAYLPRWKKDFIIYYGLDTALIENKNETETEAAVIKLTECGVTDREIFDCLNLLSSHKLTKSPVYAKTPDDVINVVTRVYRAAEVCFGGKGAAASMFGSIVTSVYSMFSSAVFYADKWHRDVTVTVSGIERFECDGGMWKHTVFMPSSTKLKVLGAVMKNIDAEMREKTGCKRKLSHIQTAGFFEDTVRNTVRDYYEEKARAARPVIKIDVSVLDSIRETAMITQQRLTVEEEYDEPEPQQTPQTDTDFPLDENEMQVLKALLSGENPDGLCRKNGLMLSVVCDAINEKLFELFNDNVIEFFDYPVIIEDYGEELKKMLEVD